MRVYDRTVLRKQPWQANLIGNCLGPALPSNRIRHYYEWEVQKIPPVLLKEAFDILSDRLWTGVTVSKLYGVLQ